MKNEEILHRGQGKVVLQWSAPEYIKHEKGKKWYLSAGIIAVFAALWSIITGNYTLAIAIVVLAVVYEYIQLYHPPKIIEIKVKEMGIKVGEIFYPYSDIVAFWIFYDHGNTTLNLRIANSIIPNVVIQLEDQGPVELRHYLVGQIREWEGKEERLGDMLLRFLKL
jgi:uncharacterized membrane protein YobD (UPF0266 family)